MRLHGPGSYRVRISANDGTADRLTVVADGNRSSSEGQPCSYRSVQALSVPMATRCARDKLPLTPALWKRGNADR